MWKWAKLGKSMAHGVLISTWLIRTPCDHSFALRCSDGCETVWLSSMDLNKDSGKPLDYHPCVAFFSILVSLTLRCRVPETPVPWSAQKSVVVPMHNNKSGPYGDDEEQQFKYMWFPGLYHTAVNAMTGWFWETLIIREAFGETEELLQLPDSHSGFPCVCPELRPYRYFRWTSQATVWTTFLLMWLFSVYHPVLR